MRKFSRSPFAASILPTILLTASLAAPAVSRAQDGPKTPLAEQMGGISQDFRALRKVVSDPSKKDAADKLVKDMVARATKAQGFQPAKTKEIVTADQTQFVADYKKEMDGLIADFQTLDADINAGKTTDAAALLDKLNMDKRDGHKKFNAGDDHAAAGSVPWPAAGAAPAVSGTAG